MLRKNYEKNMNENIRNSKKRILSKRTKKMYLSNETRKGASIVKQKITISNVRYREL